LGEYGTLEGLLAAVTDTGSGLSASVRSKLAAAIDYLTAAPAVVRLVRDLELPAIEEAGAQLSPVAGEARAELERLAIEWNLGGSVKRLLGALDVRR
ncbi:5'-3' exonuclease, partial [Arthrobacter sp. Hiyo6]